VNRPDVDRTSPTEADLRVAHVLLRSGNALSARVQLETLAGRRQLDVRGLVDLAESRWRTGDLSGAGDAVAAYLEAGGDEPLAYVIAAEATAAIGRPGEARKLARRALEGLSLPLDAVFAGQPRSSIWPRDPAAPAQPAGTLFAPTPTEASRGGRIGLTADPRPIGRGGPPNAAGPAGPSAPSWVDRGEVRQRQGGAATGGEQDIGGAELQPDRSLWDMSQDPTMPDVAAELDAAREALAADDMRAAAVRLAIVLRMSPALAPAVLDLIGPLPGADFDLLRGDALRLVGHEAAAERAFAAAVDSLRDTTPPRSSE
jgi:hypothetical protein